MHFNSPFCPASISHLVFLLLYPPHASSALPGEETHSPDERGGKTRTREAPSSICSLPPSHLPLLFSLPPSPRLRSLHSCVRWDGKHTQRAHCSPTDPGGKLQNGLTLPKESRREVQGDPCCLCSHLRLYPGWGIQQGWYLLPLVSCNCEVFNRLLPTPDMDPGWRWIVLVLTVRGIGCGLEYWCGAPELWDVNLLGHVWFLQDAKAVWVSARLEFYTWNSHVCFHMAAGYHTNSLFSNFVKDGLLQKSMSPFLFKFAPKKISLAFNFWFV